MGSGTSSDKFLSLNRVPSGYEQEWKRLGIETKRLKPETRDCKMVSASFPPGWSIVHDPKDMRHATYHDKDGRIRVVAFFDSIIGKSQCSFLSDDEIKTYTDTDRGRSHSCASLKEPIPFSLEQVEQSIVRACRLESSLEFDFRTISPGTKPGNVYTLEPTARGSRHYFTRKNEPESIQDEQTTIDPDKVELSMLREKNIENTKNTVT